MEAVIIPIRPEWCEKIISGEKTIEIRKNAPKLDTPFKCYIYCTKPRKYFFHGGIGETLDDLYRMPSGEIKFGYSGELMCCGEPYGTDNFLNGKVIGEFICNRIRQFNRCDYLHNPTLEKASCLNEQDLYDYANGKTLFGWHISDLKIYNKPATLSRFGLTRAPQSWCYVK